MIRDHKIQCCPIIGSDKDQFEGSDQGFKGISWTGVVRFGSSHGERLSGPCHEYKGKEFLLSFIGLL